MSDMSPYLLAKSGARYAPAPNHASRTCGNCGMAVRPWGPERMQCRQIGVVDVPEADVLPGHVCRAWKVKR